MKAQSIYKVPNGKLLKIFVEFDDRNKTILWIRITGDFFAYPEEVIELLEKKLLHTKIQHDELLKKIQSVIAHNDIQLIGLNAEGLTEAIMRCVP